jgi:hypothetical protein
VKRKHSGRFWATDVEGVGGVGGGAACTVRDSVANWLSTPAIELTAPCAGYCRASAMWSEDSFAGRASRAARNDLQKASSDMAGDWRRHVRSAMILENLQFTVELGKSGKAEEGANSLPLLVNRSLTMTLVGCGTLRRVLPCRRR